MLVSRYTAQSPTPTMSAPTSPVGEPAFIEPTAAPLLGEDAQRLISCNQKLQELGIDDTIRLPRLVVIGDQSTGKSSLIEAISTIKVPRAANLCTKVPIAINLMNGSSPTSAWQCTVYTEERFAFDASFKNKAVSKKNPLGPWKERQEPTIKKVNFTEDPAKLCSLIEDAQHRSLNPLSASAESSEPQTNGKPPEKFSPNSVRLDISCKDWPNLSFVDLPGVIQSAGKGQPDYYVELVAGLAKHYARDADNVIMLTLPVNHDVSNSRSYSIIQHENAQDRTIAIFTKVDIARDEERQDCLDKYFGEEAEEFGHGHSMVMLARGVKAEQEFFSHQSWSRMDMTTRMRFGVRNLTAILRRILFQKTRETLPTNLDKIRHRLEEVKAQFDSMPEPPDALELPYQLRDQIKDFTSGLQQLLTSSRDTTTPSAWSKIWARMQEYSDQVNGHGPTMIIRTTDEARRLAKAERQIQGSSSADPMPLESDAEMSSRSTTRTTIKAQPREVLHAANSVQRFKLEDIRAINQAHYQSPVPGEVEPRALEQMYRMSVQAWGETCRTFLEDISTLLDEEVGGCINNHFGHQQHLGLYSHIRDSVENYLATAVNEEWSYLTRICDAEKRVPLTFNLKSVKQAEKTSLDLRRSKRAEVRLDLAKKEQQARNTGKKKSREPTADEIGPDPFDVEVQMAAKTRAYYEVAADRFADTICQHILAHLIPRCQDEMVQCLKEHLGLNDIARNRPHIVALMTEDAERAAHRARLTSEIKRLDEGHKYISRVLGNEASAASASHSGASDMAGGSIYADAFMANDDEELDIADLQPSPSKRKAQREDFADSPTKRAKSRSLATAYGLDVADSGGRGRGGSTLVDRSRSLEVEE